MFFESQNHKLDILFNFVTGKASDLKIKTIHFHWYTPRSSSKLNILKHCGGEGGGGGGAFQW